MSERPPIKVPIISVIGGPGSGKGTQCSKIAAKYGFVHISSGSLISRVIAGRGPKSKSLLYIVASGKLVPSESMIDQVREEIYRSLPSAKGFVMDGCPANKAQGILFEKTVGPIDIILYLDAPIGTLKGRMIHRSRASMRMDDTEDSINERIRTHLEYKEELMKEFSEKMKVINGSNSPEDVFEEIDALLDPLYE